MAQPNHSVKRAMISKANATIVSVVAAASFVVIFCLVASYTLVNQLSYQNRVIGQKKVALKQLNTDIDSVEQLVHSYSAFVNSNTGTNVIGGSTEDIGDKSGDNAQIVLDALPSKYDYPAVASSIEKIAATNNVKIKSISGTDDEASQSGSTDSSKPIPMPFVVSFEGNYQGVKSIISAFERSIRPFQIQKIQITGGESNMQLTVTGQTFFQPAKTFQIKSEVVK